MTISGFSMAKNAEKLYYPLDAAIRSILPIVDEFVVAIGDCDEDDNTRAMVEAIDSPKIKIIDTVWDLEKYPNGTENAHQTNIAKKACSGDWLFYLQADEVVHERYLDTIVRRCEALNDDPDVEGLLFKYRHFWGDYNHYIDCHGWYKHEIRIIRNRPDIHSWKSAQSFRRIPGFDEKNFRQIEGTHKLKVASVDAYIYHYGWVRPPRLMKKKQQSLDTIHKGAGNASAMHAKSPKNFDYGNLNRLKQHKDGHPEAMKPWIGQFNWQDELRFNKHPLKRKKFKHERLKYQAITVLENLLPDGRELGGARNFQLLDR